MKKKGDLTNSEQVLFENIQNGNILMIKEILSKDDVDVDCLDEHGMTPLQNAAFKGNAEICEIFLSLGADVNCNEHENRYTTLMFAALSGNKAVTSLVLDAGAKISAVNTIGRTATQMAAFVGQHDCVSLIKNFFSSEMLNYYTIPQGFEKEPKLRPDLAPVLHKFILGNNMSPVKLSVMLQDNMELVHEAPRIIQVLESISDKEIKAEDTNDVMSLKMHYLAQVVQACRKWDVERSDTGVAGFIKSLIKEQESNGAQLFQEKFIRDSIREYPHHDSELFMQIIRNLSGVEPGHDPSALAMLTQAINGARSIDIEGRCVTCNELKAEKRCSACKFVRYCNQICQKMHWCSHKKRCKDLGEKFEEVEAERKQMEEEERKAKEKEDEINKTKREIESSSQVPDTNDERVTSLETNSNEDSEPQKMVEQSEVNEN